MPIRPHRLLWMVAWVGMPRRLRSARRRRRSRLRRPWCGRQAPRAPTTARRRRTTHLLRRRRLDTTRPHRRRSSTLPRLPTTRRQAPTTAQRRPTSTQAEPPRRRTHRHLPRGLLRLPRPTRQQARTRGALVRSSRQPVQATRPRRLLSLLVHLVRDLLETSILPTRRQTNNFLIE